jgi:hypothetical protein
MERTQPQCLTQKDTFTCSIKNGTVNWLGAISNLDSTSCLPVVLANITFDANKKMMTFKRAGLLGQNDITWGEAHRTSMPTDLICKQG